MPRQLLSLVFEFAVYVHMPTPRVQGTSMAPLIESVPSLPFTLEVVHQLVTRVCERERAAQQLEVAAL